jgi:hypothetical protein
VPSDPIASAPIVWVSPSGHTDRNVAPASVLFQTPPPEAATYRVSALRGSTTRSVIRAPTFDGPTRFQVPPAVGSASACRVACSIWAWLTLAPEVNFCVRYSAGADGPPSSSSSSP